MSKGEQRWSIGDGSRIGREECGPLWQLIKVIYRELTGLDLPEEMPPRERRKVDAVLQRHREPPRIVEFNERQHFNHYRAVTMRLYPRTTRIAFDRQAWIDRCNGKRRLEGGGFGAPRPPLFPGENGRHRQRAFRDALCDLLPPEHGFLPTLRIADFQVEPWIHERDARARMSQLLERQLS